jgi:molybdenum cofactor cytidylyltransferase
MIGAVVLAAGRGTRFGGGKVLAPWRGVPLVRHVVDRLGLAGLSPVIVVCGAGEEEAALRSAIAGTEARLVVNPRPDDGLSASLRLGVEAMPSEVGAFVVALGDQPSLDVAVVRQMAEHWRDSNAAAVVPVYRGVRGNPVLFDDTMRRHLVVLRGDVGARDLLEAMGERVAWVAVDADAPRDVDTPDDLRALDG